MGYELFMRGTMVFNHFADKMFSFVLESGDFFQNNVTSEMCCCFFTKINHSIRFNLNDTPPPQVSLQKVHISVKLFYKLVSKSSSSVHLRITSQICLYNAWELSSTVNSRSRPVLNSLNYFVSRPQNGHNQFAHNRLRQPQIKQDKNNNSN